MPLGSSLRTAFSPDTTHQHPDRRSSPRYDMAGSVYWIVEGTEPVKIGMVRDISLSGAYVNSQEHPPKDELLKLEFRIGADFEMSGHVCRKESDGFAIRFDGEALNEAPVP
ncbi:MAG: PilZ domain-containing protein [Acidobacteriaceae bacterium]